MLRMSWLWCVDQAQPRPLDVDDGLGGCGLPPAAPQSPEFVDGVWGVFWWLQQLLHLLKVLMTLWGVF